MAQLEKVFPVTFGEDEIRRLCGAVVFGRADTLQRARHVHHCRALPTRLSAEVRGTWRRVYSASVVRTGGRLAPSCGCGADGFCPHTGALLLQALRAPRSFRARTPAPAATAEEPELSTAAEDQAAETPEAELRRLLDNDTLNHLRQIARRRGVSGVWHNKPEVVAGLAPTLADPKRVDAALADLDAGEWPALFAVYLAAGEGGLPAEAIVGPYRALGGRADPVPVEALFDRGLLCLAPRPGSPERYYVVPRAVAARLPTLDALARRASPPPAAPPATGLGLVESLQVVALAVGRGDLRDQRQTDQDQRWGRRAPAGWQFDPSEIAGRLAPSPWQAVPADYRLLPEPSPLSDEALGRLADQTGQTPDAVAFAFALLQALGAVEGRDPFVLREDRLQAALARPPDERLAALVAAWRTRSRWNDFTPAFGPNGPLQLRVQPNYYAGLPVGPPPLPAFRAPLARLLGQLTPGTWCDLRSFAALVRQIAPGVLGQPAMVGGRPLWWYARQRPEGRLEPLDISLAEGWTQVGVPVLGGLLAGPLRWLGLVEVAGAPPELAFRVRPAAALLAGRPVKRDAPEAPAALVVSPDLTVLVPAGTADVAVQTTLARAGELVAASAAGLRYQLTAERVLGLFESGTTGPELVDFLATRAAGGLPDEVRAAVEAWWRGYGAIHLYDNLCLVELGDDYLLPELLATSSLRSAVLHTFSPRLVAVDPAAAGRLETELTRLGHMPRLVEEP